MRRTILSLLIMFCAFGSTIAAQKPSSGPQEGAVADTTIHFLPYELWIDTGDASLAAYQIEIAATAGNVQIVGIEGGDDSHFSDPPYYDPKAMQHDRVIIADFSTAMADQLPTGRFLLVTLHMQFAGEVKPAFETTLRIAADADEKTIAATVQLLQGTDS